MCLANARSTEVLSLRTHGIKSLEFEKSHLGLFKGKEKKALQDKIDVLKAELEKARNEAAEVRKKYSDEINQINLKNSEYVSELKKPRDRVKMQHRSASLTLSENRESFISSPSEVMSYFKKYLPEPYSVSEMEDMIGNMTEYMNDVIYSQGKLQGKPILPIVYVDNPLLKQYKISFERADESSSVAFYMAAQSANKPTKEGIFFNIDMEDYESETTRKDFVIIASIFLFDVFPSSDIEKWQEFIANGICGVESGETECEGVKITIVRGSGNIRLYIGKVSSGELKIMPQ